jgi:hypothetical protein
MVKMVAWQLPCHPLLLMERIVAQTNAHNLLHDDSVADKSIICRTADKVHTASFGCTSYASCCPPPRSSSSSRRPSHNGKGRFQRFREAISVKPPWISAHIDIQRHAHSRGGAWMAPVRVCAAACGIC